MLQIEIDPAELVRGLERVIDPARLDMTPAMRVIGELLVERVHEEFDTAGQGEWPELAESTRRRRGDDAQPLLDTGRWRNSNQVEADSDSVVVSTDVEYSVFHVSSAPRSVIPLRNPYVLREDAEDEIVETIADYLTGGVL